MTNEEIVREYYEARNEGVTEKFCSERVADNVEYHLPARTALGGDFYSKSEVRKALAAISSLSGKAFKLQVLDIASGASHVIALVRATAQREGRVLDSKQAHVFNIVAVKLPASGITPMTDTPLTPSGIKLKLIARKQPPAVPSSDA